MPRVIAALALALSFACTSFTHTRMRDSIRVLQNDNGGCTAWSAGHGLWITAKHCTVIGGVEGWTIAGVPVIVRAVSPDSDLALFSGPVAPVLPVASEAPPEGATVLSYGYGINQRLLLPFTALIASNASDFFDGNDEALMILTGANGMSGMSGGPVLYRGKVVGQISGGGLPTSMTHLVGSAVTWEDVRAFVRLHVEGKSDAHWR